MHSSYVVVVLNFETTGYSCQLCLLRFKVFDINRSVNVLNKTFGFKYVLVEEFKMIWRHNMGKILSSVSLYKLSLSTYHNN